MAQMTLIKFLMAQVRDFGPAHPFLDRFDNDLVGTLHRFHSLRSKIEGQLGILYEGVDDREIASIEREIKGRIRRFHDLAKRSGVGGMDLLKARIDLEALLRFHRDLGGDYDLDDRYVIEVFAKRGDRIVLDDEYEYLATHVYPSDQDWFIVLWDDKIWADRVPNMLLVPYRILYEEWRERREKDVDKALEVYYGHEE